MFLFCSVSGASKNPVNQCQMEDLSDCAIYLCELNIVSSNVVRTIIWRYIVQHYRIQNRKWLARVKWFLLANIEISPCFAS